MKGRQVTKMSDSLTILAAKELDDKVPGWADKIDIMYLNMNSNSRCILGQVFGTGNVEDLSWFCRNKGLTLSHFYSYPGSTRDWREEVGHRRWEGG